MLEREGLAKRIVNIDLKQKVKKNNKSAPSYHYPRIIVDKHEFSMYTKHTRYTRTETPVDRGNFQ